MTLDRDLLHLTTAIEPLGQDDRQFSRDQPGLRPADLEGTTESHGACETAKAAFEKVEVRFRCCRWGSLLARNDEDIPAKEHAHSLSGDTREVDQDLHVVRRFHDVECGMVFAGGCALFGPQAGGQIGEDLAEVIHQLAGLTGGKKRELEHGKVMMSRGMGYGLRALGPGAFSWFSWLGLAAIYDVYTLILDA